MIEFNANKAVEIKCINAIAKVSFKEKRPDIQWLLENYNKNTLNSVEIKSLEDCLENYFELIKNGKLTSDGKDTLKTGYVFEPEYGLFQIYYINEPVLQKKHTIFIERIRPERKMTETISSLESFNELEGEWDSWNKDNPFTFRLYFEHNQSNPPAIIEKPSIEAKLQIISEKAKKFLVKIISNDNRFLYQDDISSNFSLDPNLSNLFQNWDKDYECLLMKYQDVNDMTQKLHFLTYKEINGCDLDFNWGKDNGNYNVKVSNLPILPAELHDAKEWLFDLIKEGIQDKKEYFTSNFLKNEENKILEKSPLKKKYPDLFLEISECCKRLSASKAFELMVKQIIIADDLYPMGGV